MQNPLSILPTRLLPWFAQNARPLPWRQDRRPYHVWLSEIMLQQTRVEAVWNYYLRFLAALPTVEDLAAAEEDKLPAELKVIARTEDGEIMAVEHRNYPVYGVQFHPESILTPDGRKIMERFLSMK